MARLAFEFCLAIDSGPPHFGTKAFLCLHDALVSFVCEIEDSVSETGGRYDTSASNDHTSYIGELVSNSKEGFRQAVKLSGLETFAYVAEFRVDPRRLFDLLRCECVRDGCLRDESDGFLRE